MSENFYETDRALAEYLLFHFGSPAEVLPDGRGPVEALDYPARCIRECLNAGDLPESARGLDLGCAVGRSTFEMARHCQEVVGIDYSGRFIEAARHLREAGHMTFAHAVEGRLTTVATAVVPASIDRSRVSFETGDAQYLRSTLGTFDLVLAANLMDRLREPRRFLDRLPGLLNPGGQLILTSPYTWLEDYTPMQNWLGGFERDGKPVRTLDTLKALLGEAFEFRGVRELPFLIREHSRKFQWSVAQASLWKRC